MSDDEDSTYDESEHESSTYDDWEHLLRALQAAFPPSHPENGTALTLPTAAVAPTTSGDDQGGD